MLYKVDTSPLETPSVEISAKKIFRHDAPVADTACLLQKLLHADELGELRHGVEKHFYTDGAFNLIQLIFYILQQTGPAHLFLTSYSIAMDAITALKKKEELGELLSVRFLIDNRVRSISPKPFDLLVSSFPDKYRTLALHAKVALIYNDEWKITVVGSQNATHNPKLERGCIFTNEEVFNFDYERLNDEFDRGAT